MGKKIVTINTSIGAKIDLHLKFDDTYRVTNVYLSESEARTTLAHLSALFPTDKDKECERLRAEIERLQAIIDNAEKEF